MGLFCFTESTFKKLLEITTKPVLTDESTKRLKHILKLEYELYSYAKLKFYNVLTKLRQLTVKRSLYKAVGPAGIATVKKMKPKEKAPIGAYNALIGAKAPAAVAKTPFGDKLTVSAKTPGRKGRKIPDGILGGKVGAPGLVPVVKSTGPFRKDKPQKEKIIGKATIPIKRIGKTVIKSPKEKTFMKVKKIVTGHHPLPQKLSKDF